MNQQPVLLIRQYVSVKYAIKYFYLIFYYSWHYRLRPPCPVFPYNKISSYIIYTRYIYIYEHIHFDYELDDNLV
jgi:hypothetical protein